jgi:beta-1,4-mannosyl-glycoprotein beta-1,4-N-acetylglucosaminyltransferase
MFFDEHMVLDIRLHMLDPYVDYFVIAESTYTHSGQSKPLWFDINQYKAFAHKIRHIIVDHPPPDLHGPNDFSDQNERGILNAYKFDNYQRNALAQGISDAKKNDIIIISDLDEIPKLESVNFSQIRQRIIIFNQIYCYYKLNLLLKGVPWYGSRACKKRHLKSPQWLRNIKSKRYHPLLRPDAWFKPNKYHDIKIIDDGGWHYAYAKQPESLQYKLLNYAHHHEFDQKKVTVEKVAQYIKDKKPIYDLSVDQTQDKTASTTQLQQIPYHELPRHIRDHQDKYQALIATEEL